MADASVTPRKRRNGPEPTAQLGRSDDQTVDAMTPADRRHGGHLFPALAVAEMLKPWPVRWLGVPDRLETRLAERFGLV